jgi:hypothetical protein
MARSHGSRRLCSRNQKRYAAIGTVEKTRSPEMPRERERWASTAFCGTRQDTRSRRCGKIIEADVRRFCSLSLDLTRAYGAAPGTFQEIHKL